MNKIKQNRYIIGIGILLLLMILLVNHSITSFALSDKEKIIYAGNRLISDNSYKLEGVISGEGVDGINLETGGINLYFDGVINSQIRHINVYLDNSLNSNDPFFEYYGAETRHIIMTPIEQLSKIKIESQGIIDRSNDNLINTIEQYLRDPIIKKNQVISVNTGTYNKINILTDCYQYTLSNDAIYGLALGLSDNGKASLIKEMVNNAELMVYIDNNLYIRRVIILFQLADSRQLKAEININGYNKGYSINMPDENNAIDIVNLSEEEIDTLLKDITSNNY